MKLNDRLAKEIYIRSHYDLSKLKKPKPIPSVKGLESVLFPLQKEIIHHPAKRKCLFFGRRASKTFIVTVALLREILTGPIGVNSFYISTTREQAERTIWNQIIELTERFSLPVKLNHAKLCVSSDRGSLYLKGMETTLDIEKLRGEKTAMIVIDEAAMQKDYIGYFIQEILGPSLQDYDGTIFLASTPNRTCNGYFHDITVDKVKGWKTWYATVGDNPEFPLWAGKADWENKVPRFLKKVRDEEGWTEDSPAYRREWLCEWVRSKEVCVVPFNDEKNIYTEEQTNKYIMGLDFGEVDQNAICVIGYNMYDNNIYVVDGSHFPSEGFEETCNTIMEFYHKYRPHTIVGDPQPGKVFMNDLARKYNIPIQSANKRDKAQSMELLGTDFLSGRIKFNPKLKPEIAQIKALLWVDKEKGTMTKPRDFFDAFRYSYVETLGYKKKAKIENIDPQKNSDLYQKLYFEKKQKKIREDLRLNQQEHINGTNGNPLVVRK